MELVLHVPIRPTSWNTLARKNHWAYTKTFGEMKLATLASLNAYGRGLPCFSKPVKVRVYARWKRNGKHDLDNIVLKPILDLLVDEHVLRGDDVSCIGEIVLTGAGGCDDDGYIVTVTDS